MNDPVKSVTEHKHVYRVEGFSCANCAGKFEKNVKQLPGVEDAKVNFGASKINVFGNTTVEELEKAGAFENLKVVPEKLGTHTSHAVERENKEEKIPFIKSIVHYLRRYCFLFLDTYLYI